LVNSKGVFDKDVKDKSESLKIVNEDILRILGEQGGKCSLECISSKLNQPSSFEKAIKKLTNQELLRLQGDIAKLSEKGKATAGLICEKHNVIENYWIKKALADEEEAHQAAHLLEHHVSEKVIDNIRTISKIQRQGTLLSEFTGKEGMITNIVLEGGMFERLISMGFSPGEKLEIVEKLSNSIVITIKNKKLAIDREIANKIRVLEGVQFYG